MSTLRFAESVGMSDVTAVQDLGTTMDITNLDAFDLGLLGNQKKLTGTPPRSPLPVSDIRAVDEIEFVNLEDTNVTFNVKPMATNTNDTIRILRDTSPAVRPSTDAPFSLNSSVSPTFVSAPAAPAVPMTPAAPAAASNWFNFPGLGKSTTTAAANTSTGGGFSSWFGNGSSSAAAPQSNVESLPAGAPYMSPEIEAVKKTELLTLLERMDRKGVGGNKMTTANTFEEINAELERRKDSKALEASIRFQRSMLTTVTSGMEFLNNRYDPLGVALDGWSETINENVEDYDEIFEELYDKYKDKSKVAPEIRLVMTLGLSAAMCHITNTMFKSRMPGMDDILRKNPDLARQMAQAAATQAVGPGFANFVSMGMPQPSAQQQQQHQQQQRNMNTTPMFSEPPQESPRAFMAPMGSGMGAEIQSNDPRDVPTARREMRGPIGVGVDDILRTLSSANNNTSADADETGSFTSGMTTDTMRRNGMSRRRKITTTQPTGATLTLNV